MGYSVGNDDNDNESVHNDNKRVVVSEHPSLKTRLREEYQRGPGLLQDLIDDVMQSNRRSELLESQTVIAKGPIGDRVMEQEEETMHSYATKKKFDCPKFQHDLYEVCIIQVRFLLSCQFERRAFETSTASRALYGRPHERITQSNEIAFRLLIRTVIYSLQKVSKYARQSIS